MKEIPINTTEFDFELKKLLENIESIKADVDLYSAIVDEQLTVSAV